MARSVLERAHTLLQRRKFSHVISLLESGVNPELYRESFDYFVTAGTACLYLGDTGSAGAYFQRARHIRMTDPTLLNAQAVLFLRRGDTDRAISYYLDVLEYDPDNKIALSAMEFIRTHGTDEEVFRAVDSGEIERFYPPLGVNPDVVRRITFSVFAGVVLALLIFNVPRFSRFVQNLRLSASSERADLSELYLSVEEIGNAHKKDSAEGSFKYTLTDTQIKKSFDMAMTYFQEFRDNAALVEINRLLNSNASDSIKAKTLMMLSKVEEKEEDEAPTFASLSEYNDNIEYAMVDENPELYVGCVVSWSGTISGASVVTEGKSYRCDLFVSAGGGADGSTPRIGVVPLFFAVAPYPAIDTKRPVTVLAKIKSDTSGDGGIMLEGMAVYQPIKRNN